jgi:hypothetical protein
MCSLVKGGNGSSVKPRSVENGSSVTISRVLMAVYVGIWGKERCDG